MTTSDNSEGAVSQLANAHVLGLEAYVPGKQPTEGGWVKLNTNELPYPASSAVGPAIAAEIDLLAKYPSPTSASLREAIAQLHGLDAGQVIVGNGSDDILNLLMRVFVGGELSLLQATPCYSLYPVLAAIQNGKVETIGFDRDMKVPVERLAESKASILILTTPNAPTGVSVSNSVIEEVLKHFKGIVVADEAYADFAEWNAVELLSRYERLVVTRTFSKSYGLAGLRVGYGLASAETIGLLDRVRDSYNVNRLSQAGALAALKDQAHLRNVVERVKTTRERFVELLEARGWEVYPSAANFIFGRPVNARGERGQGVAESLFNWFLEQKILVRYFGSSPLTADGLRISIGTDSDMDRVIGVIDTWQN